MFILRRFLAFIPVALIVALIVFLMLHLAPGDPVAAIAGDSATAADIARIRAELGLDDPLPEQFVRWCMELIQGDLGRSYFLNRPVGSDRRPRWSDIVTGGLHDRSHRSHCRSARRLGGLPPRRLG